MPALDLAEQDDAVVILTGRNGVFSAGFGLPVLRGGGPDALTTVPAPDLHEAARGAAAGWPRSAAQPMRRREPRHQRCTSCSVTRAGWSARCSSTAFTCSGPSGAMLDGLKPAGPAGLPPQDVVACPDADGC